MSDMIVREADNYLPVMTIAEALDRQKMIREYTAALMVDGEDYGEIPGTGKKRVLFKPGAEKLCRIFALNPRFTDVSVVEDWTGGDHDGEPFLSYTIKCSLYRKEAFMGDADGSCNSWEKKYRYVKQERVCPSCGAAAIGKSKEEWGGGWYCNKNRGGCGAKFAKGNKGIEDQAQGQVVNPDIADLANTLRKMAQKRALVAACLIVVGASEFFTQDVETEQPAQHQPSRPQPAPKEEAIEAEFKETGFTPPTALQTAMDSFAETVCKFNPGFADGKYTWNWMAKWMRTIVENPAPLPQVAGDAGEWALATGTLNAFLSQYPGTKQITVEQGAAMERQVPDGSVRIWEITGSEWRQMTEPMKDKE